MHWLIDGYNVIHRDPDLRGHESGSLEAGRAALLRLLARVARDSGEDFVVVFDGVPVRGGAPAGGQVEVLFSRRPETADDVLIRLAARWREGGVVVSSDRTVRSAARRAGCAVLAAEEFLTAVDEAATRDVEDEERDDGSQGTRGNPRRLSRDDRAAQRALRRLRGR